MSRFPRVDYDKIAPLWDSQPYRSKSFDPQFVAFLEERAARTLLRVLDIGCGTGNQLIANRAAVPNALMTGVDQSIGMLAEARRKAPDIAWVRADAAPLPFAAGSFDFIGCQFAFHHFGDKAGMLAETLRLLRPGALCCAICARRNAWTGFATNIFRRRGRPICGISGRPPR